MSLALPAIKPLVVNFGKYLINFGIIPNTIYIYNKFSFRPILQTTRYQHYSNSLKLLAAREVKLKLSNDVLLEQMTAGTPLWFLIKRQRWSCGGGFNDSLLFVHKTRKSLSTHVATYNFKFKLPQRPSDFIGIGNHAYSQLTAPAVSLRRDTCVLYFCLARCTC